MRTLIVYDSDYGNTATVARAVGEALGNDTRLVRAEEADAAELTSLELLIVGSPTQGGRPTAEIKQFLNKIPANTLKDVDVAAFDTRFAEKDHGFGLQLLMKAIGFAAGRIAHDLQSKGGHLAAPPEGFFVKDKEGPLGEGELERAGRWAEAIRRSRN
jgi:flavodoxin I